MIVFLALALAASVLGFHVTNDTLFVGFMVGFVAEAVGYNTRRVLAALSEPARLTDDR